MSLSIEAIKEAASLPAIVEQLTGFPGQNAMYHCPVCHSGEGPNGTGAFHILPDSGNKTFYCHSCKSTGDVLDLAGLIYNTDDKHEQMKHVAQWAGIPLDDTYPTYKSTAPSHDQPDKENAEVPDAAVLEAEREYVERCRENIEAPDALSYLMNRGVDMDTAKKVGLGYDPKKRRIIIPFPGDSGYHIDRAIDHNGDRKYLKPPKIKQPLWNPDALNKERVIVVEGPMDAIALDLAGHGEETVALCGTAWKPLMEELKARDYGGTVLVALDDDEAGTKAQDDLLSALDTARIKAAPLGVWGEVGTKDASEAWQKDADGLTVALEAAITRAVQVAEGRVEEIELAAYEATMERLHVVGAGTAIGNVLLLSSAVDPVPTGISSLDEKLGGGMSPGLYVIGATSSLGKSTFMGQIADNLAMAGHPVLFAALEMSAEEMAAKSFSRYIATHPGPDGRVREEGALHFLRPSWRNGVFCDDGMKRAIVDAARDLYDSLGDRLRYLVADSEPTVQDVSDVAYHMKRAHGTPPVIFVDYLQLLKTPEGSLSDKQAVDRNVSTLRRLARDLKTPVVAVSSLNRAGYWGAVTMEAFKESGSIEYGSDVLMGIQPHGMGTDLDEVRSDKEAEKKGRQIVNDSKLKMVRDVDITILKNRWGKITGYAEGVHLVYHVIGNYFDEPGQGKPFYSSMQP